MLDKDEEPANKNVERVLKYFSYGFDIDLNNFEVNRQHIIDHQLKDFFDGTLDSNKYKFVPKLEIVQKK